MRAHFGVSAALLFVTCTAASFFTRSEEPFSEVASTIGAVLQSVSESTCSLIIFADEFLPSSAIYEIQERVKPPWGVGVFRAALEGSDVGYNQTKFLQLINEARKMRMASRCVNVVVVSENTDFLSTFAHLSLKGRLLVWATRLLVVTQVREAHLQALLRENWTFAMMNTVILNEEQHKGKRRFKAKVYLPYSVCGSCSMEVGVWTPNHGLFVKRRHAIFPEKYANFHGARVNMTALPWPPNWGEKVTRTENGSNVIEYSGTDYNAMDTLAEALNFTINFLPVNDFPEVSTRTEVTGLVEERISFISGLTYGIMPERLQRFDYVFSYDFYYSTFCMATPRVESRWYSVFTPLSFNVWVGVVFSLCLVPPLALLISNVLEENGLSTSHTFEAVYKILVGQDFDPHSVRTTASRLMIAAWLIFGLIIGAAYRGNLTASLSLPVTPRRTETLQELVQTVKGITIPSYGDDFKRSLLASEYDLYRRLSNLLLVVESEDEAFRMAIESKYASMSNRRYLDYLIARDFTTGGRSKLYVGKDNFFKTSAGFPVPHDAPYIPTFQRYILAFVEHGLFVKWRRDMAETARKESLTKQQETQDLEAEGESGGAGPLAFSHVQGAFVILAFGLASASLVFIAEKVYYTVHLGVVFRRH